MTCFRTELRRQIAELCNFGIESRKEIDRLERLAETDAAADLATTFAVATTAQLGRLRTAFREERVIHGAYTKLTASGLSGGCLFHWLFGWERNAELFAWDVSDDLWLCCSRSMRRWDYQTIDAQFVIGLLDRELNSRKPAAPAQAKKARPRAEPNLRATNASHRQRPLSRRASATALAAAGPVGQPV